MDGILATDKMILSDVAEGLIIDVHSLSPHTGILTKIVDPLCLSK